MSTAPTVKVFLSPAKPIPSQVSAFDAAGLVATWPPTTSTLISSGPESLLVDALMTKEESQQLAGWVGLQATDLRAVYVTHPHADHLFGLAAILDDNPEARAITLRRLVPFMAEQTSEAYLKVWSGFFPDQIADRLPLPQALDGDTFDLAGAVIRFVDVGQTDTEPSSVVHVPEGEYVIAGDVAYNGIHMWMAGSTDESRRRWLEALDVIEALKPRHIITGHADPAAPDHDAARILDESREYLSSYDTCARESGSPEELVARMMKTHGNLGNPYTLWLAAYQQFVVAAV